MNKDDDFYVGYMPQAPASLARWLRPRIALLLVLVAAIALLLASAQGPLGPGNFDFGAEDSFEGVVYTHPYPMLRVARPGASGHLPAYSLYYLTVFGKHGANQACAGLDGQRVRLKGAIIYRDNQVMIEMVDGSIESLGEGEALQAGDLGMLTVSGEIVDSKCFLGVMKPGNLKTHKACAIRCISGGVPPVLLVRDPEGNAHYFMLTDTAGAAVNGRVLDKVATPLRITGRLGRLDNLFTLAADPDAYVLQR